MFGLFSKKTKNEKNTAKAERKAKEEAIQKSRRSFLKKAAIGTAALTLGPTINTMANTLGINEEKEKLNFTPIKRPTYLSEKEYDDLNLLLSKMEVFFKKGGKAHRLDNEVGKFKAFIPETKTGKQYDNKIYDHVVNTILSNTQYFKFSKSVLKLSKSSPFSKNKDNAYKNLKNFINTPYQITDMEADANIILEFAHGKTHTAEDASRTIEDTAKEVAKLYNGLHYSSAYNLPKGKEKKNVLYLDENDGIDWGSFPKGFDENQVPELICKATLEYENETEKMHKIALNMKLAYQRTEKFNTLVSNELKSLGNKEMSDTFKKRAADYKRKSVSISSKMSQNREKPGSAKYTFKEEELEQFLTPGDKNKKHSRKVILSIPITQRSSAARHVKTKKIVPILCVMNKESGEKESNFYNKEYEVKYNKYANYIRQPMNKILDWENEDKELVNKETMRITTQGGKQYHTNNYKKSGFQKVN